MQPHSHVPARPGAAAYPCTGDGLPGVSGTLKTLQRDAPVCVVRFHQILRGVFEWEHLLSKARVPIITALQQQDEQLSDFTGRPFVTENRASKPGKQRPGLPSRLECREPPASSPEEASVLKQSPDALKAGDCPGSVEC